MVSTVVIACSSLGAIVGVSLIFMWWWFPRKWNSGNKNDTEALALGMSAIGPGNRDAGLSAEERRKAAGQRAREYLAKVEERNRARKEGREVGEAPVLEM